MKRGKATELVHVVEKQINSPPRDLQEIFVKAVHWERQAGFILDCSVVPEKTQLCGHIFSETPHTAHICDA